GGKVQAVSAAGLGLHAGRVLGAPGDAIEGGGEGIAQPLGGTLAHDTAETAGRVTGGRVDEDSRHPLRTVRTVDSLPKRGGRVAAVQAPLVDQCVGEGVEQDESSIDRGGHVLRGGIPSGDLCSSAQLSTVVLTDAQRPALGSGRVLPVAQAVLVQGEEDALSAHLDGG